MRRLVHIQQIPIHIVLQNKPGRIKPVIKDLAAHDVSPNTPAVGVALLAQPVVAEHLGVEVVGFEGGVVDVRLGALEEEKAVVVDEFGAAVETEEDGYVDVVVVVHELSDVSCMSRELKAGGLDLFAWKAHLAGVEVEVAAVKLVAFSVVCDAHSKMAEFVHRRRAFCEALRLVGAAVLLVRLRGVSDRGPTPTDPRQEHNTHVVVSKRREPRIFPLNKCLSIDQMEREAINRVVKRDPLATTGNILQLVHRRRLALRRQRLGCVH